MQHLHLPNATRTLLSSSSSSSSDTVASRFSSLLNQCRISLPTTQRLHQQILTSGLLPHPTLPASLIAAYLSSGAASAALAVLRRLSPSPVFWWNQLIRHAITNALPHTALSLYRSMLRLGTAPDHYTFPLALKACGELPSFKQGASIHAVVCSSGFESNVFVCNALVSMYPRCGAPEDARHVFDEITSRGIDDMISWNSMVAAYVKSGKPRLGLEVFARSMRAAGDRAGERRSDVIGLVNILPACASLRAASQAREIHGYAVRNGLVLDVFVGNAIVDVYAKCGMMDDALEVFNHMESRDVVSWNAMVTGYSQNSKFQEALELFEKMREENVTLNVVTWSAVIAGYAQQGHGHEALGVFRQMQLSGSEPNAVTIISLLSACSSVGALMQGMETHGHALRRCLMKWDDDDSGGEDLMVQNALIDMYAKCQCFDLAQSLFDSIPLMDRSVVTWTVMIGGYAQHGDANAALELFSDMMLKSNSAVPNAFTISCVLMACARLSALRLGKQIHAYVIREKDLATVTHVSNCLIDMYSKCGSIRAAQDVFDRMQQRNSVSWTSLMTGYGIHGHGDDALCIFEEMQKAGFTPDGITFLVVLHACSHSGMVAQGIKYFNSMSNDYRVVAGSEHYACMVDVLGRAGRLDEAWKMIQSMPMKPNAVVWVALLSACRVHRNVELAEYATAGLVELKCQNDGTYTLLSNIYANAGRWGDVARIRSLMKRSGIKKRPGWSWVQGMKGTAAFFVGDRSHPQSKQIYALLGTLIERIRAIGYIPQTDFALHDVDDEEKTYLLSEHSEKLALAFGILNSPPGTPIRITKNLRVCGDCHSAITFISMIVEHEIILRDPSRFHHFKNGSCSCGGYW